ncbi:hypothetical protein HanLR1_Chr08g0266801 [Helianthus annuus]|nr:hypothetical protein HanLR1_Chr08g0266801 [Helianthus annuus]
MLSKVKGLKLPKLKNLVTKLVKQKPNTPFGGVGRPGTREGAIPHSSNPKSCLSSQLKE